MRYLEKLEEAKRGRCWKDSCIKESRLNPDNRNPLIEAYMSLFLEGRKTKAQKNNTRERRGAGKEYQDKHEVLNPVSSSDAARIEKSKFGEVDKEGQKQKKAEIRGRLRTAAGQLGQVDPDKLEKLKARLKSGQGVARKTTFTSPEQVVKNKKAAADQADAEKKAAAARELEAQKKAEGLRATEIKQAERRGALQHLATQQRRRRNSQADNSPEPASEPEPKPEPKSESKPESKPEPKPKPTPATKPRRRGLTSRILKTSAKLTGAAKVAARVSTAGDPEAAVNAARTALRDRRRSRLSYRLRSLEAEREKRLRGGSSNEQPER